MAGFAWQAAQAPANTSAPLPPDSCALTAAAAVAAKTMTAALALFMFSVTYEDARCCLLPCADERAPIAARRPRIPNVAAAGSREPALCESRGSDGSVPAAEVGDGTAEPLEERLQRLAFVLAVVRHERGDAPGVEDALLQAIRAAHEDVRARPDVLVSRALPEPVQPPEQQAQVDVRHAVADEEQRRAEGVRRELDVERILKRKP